MIKKLLLLFFCSSVALLAQSIYDVNESDTTNYQKIQSIFLSHEGAPLKIFVNEIFAIKIKAIVSNDNFEEIRTSFQNSQGIEVLNPDSKWEWSSDNIFFNTFYMKTHSTTAKLPSLTLHTYKNLYEIDSSTLKIIAPKIIKLNKSEQFSGVIAKSLNIKKNKTTRFDDKNFIVVLEVEAKLANLDDFNLEWVVRDGIDSSSANLPYSSIFYYAIVPSYTKDFIFTYFNTTANRFEKISLPIVMSDDRISTQIDLNPAQSSLQIYKDGAYGVVALILILLFIRRRKAGYIVFLIMLIGLFVYNKNPLNSIKIDKGAEIKILPTEKSTIFYITNRTIYAQKLDSKDNYTKILLPNGKIGWIYGSKD